MALSRWESRDEFFRLESNHEPFPSLVRLHRLLPRGDRLLELSRHPPDTPAPRRAPGAGGDAPAENVLEVGGLNANAWLGTFSAKMAQHLLSSSELSP